MVTRLHGHICASVRTKWCPKTIFLYIFDFAYQFRRYIEIRMHKSSLLLSLSLFRFKIENKIFLYSESVRLSHSHIRMVLTSLRIHKEYILFIGMWFSISFLPMNCSFDQDDSMFVCAGVGVCVCVIVILLQIHFHLYKCMHFRQSKQFHCNHLYSMPRCKDI